MRPVHFAISALLLGLLPAFAPRAGAQETVELFNGRDLEGWVVVNGAPSTWTVRDGLLVCSGKPTGLLRSERQYENFVLDLEWRHMQSGGNSGLFVWSDPLPIAGSPFTRAIEVQVMDGVETENYTSQGDIFSIQGASMVPDRPHPAGWARCLPSEPRVKPSPEWNRYRVTCRDGAIKLEVNGKEVSGGYACRPRRGYLCLESEGSEIQFRNIRIQEFPRTPAEYGAEMGAPRAANFRPLYNGVDLSGWKPDPANEGHWRPSDWRLDYDGQGADLWTVGEFGDFELIVDWRWAGEAQPEEVPVVLPDGSTGRTAAGEEARVVVPVAGDSGVYLRGSSKSQVNMWCWPIGSGEVHGYRTDASLPAEVRRAVTPRLCADAPIGEWNRFRIRMVGDRLWVELNGQPVIEDARLPGVAPRGPIALQHHGAPLQFANLYVRDLDG